MCCFLYIIYFIHEVPKLPIREFTALLTSFFSPCLSPSRFSLRQTRKIAVRGLSELKFSHFLALRPGTSLVAFLRCSLPIWTSCPAAGRILDNHVCECDIEICGPFTNANEIQYSTYLYFLPKAIVTHQACFASVVCGLDFTWAVHMQPPSPVPTSPQCTLLHFLSQLAEDSPLYF